MAPKISFTREAIVEAALSVVRDHGHAALSARTIAAALGGSTRPLYRAFASIDELRATVAERAEEMALEASERASDPESHFLAIGLGYLAFSRAEPNLFALLLTEGRETRSASGPRRRYSRLNEKMRRDPFLAGLTDERLEALHRDMFIFTHGISALASEHPTEDELRAERELLRDVGGRLIFVAKMEESGADMEAMMRRFHDESGGTER